MALDFPSSPTNGQKYPASPIIGIPTYTWDGEKWTTIGGSMGTLDPATAMPLQDATPGVVGTALKYAREDHVHPINTSIIPVAATAAEYIANSAPTKMLTPGAAWLAAATTPTVPDVATLTVDLSGGFDFNIRLTSTGYTLGNPTNLKAGQKGLIFISQDATGGRAITGWGSAWKFVGGLKPVLSSAPNAVDVISYFAAGTAGSPAMYCTFSAGFA